MALLYLYYENNIIEDSVYFCFLRWLVIVAQMGKLNCSPYLRLLLQASYREGHQGHSSGHRICLGDWAPPYLCCHHAHLEKTVVNLKDREIWIGLFSLRNKLIKIFHQQKISKILHLYFLMYQQSTQSCKSLNSAPTFKYVAKFNHRAVSLKLRWKH